MKPPVGYIAYIDEAGDDGLQRVKPSAPDAASEWITLSGFLIKAERQSELLPWLKTLIGSYNQHQMTHLHFRQLREDQKTSACNYVVNLPVRLFTVASNKRNMVQYGNVRAEKAKINVTAWFYVWLTRILLERITNYVSRRTLKDYNETRTVRLEFASRGGVKIDDVARYLAYLKDQSEFGMLHNSFWEPKWDVVDFTEIVTFPAKEHAGLQWADCVASAFYSGLERTAQGKVSPSYAMSLCPRMARSGRGRIFGFGLKVWPDFVGTLIEPNQKELLDFYRDK